MHIPDDVLRLWDKYGLDEGVRRHCLTVARIALKIAEKIRENSHDVDMDAVLRGALLHDIGRAVTHDPFQHFVKSAEILRKENVDEKIVRVAERHFSAGITAEEAKKLGLEPKDYMPETLEEKIVSFADNLAMGDREETFEEFMKRLDEIDRKNPEMRWLTERTRERARRIKEELERLSSLVF
ncbi:MAG: TIGR00295 family protein [Archaeoglobus sp.]|uniref:TIGR00295 family protein n=1 Tax=Archaeoglobus sp. TaxID=1872626 RepID=UPI001D860063|nr:TIGR00295 family protein [Archaeoglobus sp.]MBO8180418.1 TIGR00295 family protein [Archaeoglobus sp.]